MKVVPEPAENYITQMNHLQERGRSFRVWSAAAALVFFWVALIILPPVLAGFKHTGIASPIYYFFSHICHQIPERSFHFGGHQFAVCSRCFGVYFGLLAGMLVYPLWRRVDNTEPLPRKWLLLSGVPMGIDWSLTVLDIWENTHVTRFLTGLILGAACATYILPAVVEIIGNLAEQKSRRKPEP